jgi:hypothetical protein
MSARDGACCGGACAGTEMVNASSDKEISFVIGHLSLITCHLSSVIVLAESIATDE